MTHRRRGVVIGALAVILGLFGVGPSGPHPWATGLAHGSMPVGRDGSARAAWLWNIEAVSIPGGGYTSLGVDSTGRPHIAYRYGNPRYDLAYAHFDGTHWLTTTVDAAGYVGNWASLALDGQDHPHIAYQAVDDGDVRYASYDGAAWITTTVDTMDRLGWYISLALDSTGRPHISYFDDTNANLRYAYYDGVDWQVEIVDTMDQPGWWSSIAVDVDNQPHIAYHDRAQGSLKYARREGIGWHVAVVDASNYAGWHTSIAVDSAGRPHISYCTNYYPRALCDDLRYASYDGTAWLTTTVDSAGWTGGWSSLELDRRDQPRIAYCHYHYTVEWSYCDELRYAYPGGQGWQIEIVDTGHQPGWYASLELDLYENPHISYFENEQVTLHYATGCMPVSGAEIAGPSTLIVGGAGNYAATPLPPTASLPLTLTWDNGATGPTAIYSWAVTGTQTVTVTAANGCGQGMGTRVVQVLPAWPDTFYLPMVVVPRR